MADLPDYDSVKEALKILKALGEASETHGLLCSLYVVGAKIRKQAWIDSILNQAMDQDDSVAEGATKVLTRLYEATEADFSATKLKLRLLLPSQDSDIEERVEALAHWTQGFLSGLKLSGLDAEKPCNKEMGLIMENLLEISCLGYSGEPKEEADPAIAELTDYLSFAVGDVQEELLREKAGSQSGNQTKH